MIEFTFRAWQKWGPIWETFGHLKDDRNPKQKKGHGEPLANINSQPKMKKRHGFTLSWSFATLSRRSSKSTPAHGKKKICSIIQRNPVFIIHYDCEPVFEHNHAMNLVAWKSLTASALRMPADINSNEQAHPVLNSRWFCGRFKPYIIIGREHRCEQVFALPRPPSLPSVTECMSAFQDTTSGHIKLPRLHLRTFFL